MTLPLLIVLTIFVAERCFHYFLDGVNLKHQKINGLNIPQGFEGVIDTDTLRKTTEYSIAKTRFGIFSGIFGDLTTGFFLFTGLLGMYSAWNTSLQLPFILSGLIFLLPLMYAENILNIPFDIYQNFKIEKKFGFNTMTPGLWFSDFIKSILIETILFGALLSAGLWIVLSSSSLWWLWLWLFFFTFSLFMLYISPYVIEPLFNKFTPLDDPELEEKIKLTLAKTGISVSRVFKMDASKRSKHTNAYFTGIGHVKRIVLFDTLLKQMNADEIVSVLAHEAGHWKKKHVLKTIIAYEVISLVVFFLAFQLIQKPFLSELFHINNDSFFAKVVILGFLGGLAGFFAAPLSAFLSRRNEREADRYAFDLIGTCEHLVSALIKLSKDNLSNLHPHPLYVAFHYSHPPVLDRIKTLRSFRAYNN